MADSFGTELTQCERLRTAVRVGRASGAALCTDLPHSDGVACSGEPLSTLQARAFSALLADATVTAAAEAASVDRSTVRRWLRADSGFSPAHLDCSRELVGRTTSPRARGNG